MRHTLSAALFALLVPAAAVAQTTDARPAVSYDQILSTNPLGVVVKWFNVEYERKLGPEVTLGASASTNAKVVPRSSARQRRRPSPRSNPGLRRRQMPQRSRSRQVGRAATTTSPSSPIHTSSTTTRRTVPTVFGSSA